MSYHISKLIYSIILLLVFTNVIYADTKTRVGSDNQSLDLLEQYIKTSGDSIIVFDASNIKQYWTNYSVISKDGLILIYFSGNNSTNDTQYKFQLQNVQENFDCKVDIISDDQDVVFDVLNSESKRISVSSQSEPFLSYHISHSVFHLEDAMDFSFSLNFKPNIDTSLVSIRKIVLSFFKNKDSKFLSSPGVLNVTYDNSTIRADSNKIIDDGSIILSGKKRALLFAQNKIYMRDNQITTTATIKNSGNTDVDIRIAYDVYSDKKLPIDRNQYPLPESKIMEIVSGTAGSNTILVKGYSKWEKGCYLAYNALDDFSDIPSYSLLEQTIIEITKKDNDLSEIILDKPLQESLEKGLRVRVHGRKAGYFIQERKTIKPNEEIIFNNSTNKDDNLVKFSSQPFGKGVYYIVPMILINPVDSQNDYSIIIKNFSVSY